MFIHLLRHAHAGDPGAWTGPDAARPLSDKGRDQSDRLGRFLAGIHFRPDLVLTSPRLRASETAEIVAGHLRMSVETDDRLGGGLDLPTLDELLADHGGPRSSVLVGHDPDFSDLVSTLCGAGLVMRKGALARIEAERPLEPGGGILRWLVPPDLLRPER
jgi:phosphohistidine phosphatase